MGYTIKVLYKFYLKSSVWFASIIIFYTVVNNINNLKTFSFTNILVISMILGLVQMSIEHIQIKKSDSELNKQVKQFQIMKHTKNKTMTKTNSKILTPGIADLKMQPGIINILFAFAIMNPKFLTIVEQCNMGVDVSDEDGHLFLKQYRLSVPEKIIISKEECIEENRYTMSLAREVRIQKLQSI